MAKQNFFEINDKESASYLTKLKHLTYIQPFLIEACTISQAAQITNVQEHQMHYFVNKI